ncbi:MAG: polysaccharide deacetylase family protein [Burkholderiaceae bacterium]|nr:polysaccharide deacetylase family protein [Burkholderiaceae bacterium]
MMRGLFALAAGSGRRARLSILVFHRVLPRPDPVFPEEVDFDRFDTICSWVRDWFNVLPLDEAARRLAEGTLPSRALAITFDDGYSDNRLHAAPILRRHGLPCTFFIATGMLDGGLMWNDTLIEAMRHTRLPQLDLRAVHPELGEHALDDPASRRRAIDRTIGALKYLEPGIRRDRVQAVARAAQVEPARDLMMSSQQVRELRSMGMQIGAHTITHPILASMTDESARAEIVDSRRHLEAILGEPVRLFAYPNGKPGGDYDARHVEMVREAGFAAAASTVWGVSTRGSDRFQLRRFSPWDRSRLRFGLRMLGNIVKPEAPVHTPANAGLHA